MRFTVVTAFCVILAFWLAGCGGGGGSATPVPLPTTTRAKFNVAWAARSRTIDARSSALSAVATLRQASPTGSDVSFTFNRNAAPNAYTKEEIFPVDVNVGTRTFDLRFYAQPNGAGAVVGRAEATVTIAADGSGIGTIAVNWTITSVELTAGQVIKAGERKDLQFSARDASGALVSVTPGSAQTTLVTGSDYLRVVEGQAEGIVPGSATLTIEIDGVTSRAVPVRIGSDTAIILTPQNPTISIEANQTFVANVSNSPSTAVTWSVREGNVGGTITANGVYTAPSTPGTYTIQAVSQYDSAVSVAVPVQVKAGNVNATIQ